MNVVNNRVANASTRINKKTNKRNKLFKVLVNYSLNFGNAEQTVYASSKFEAEKLMREEVNSWHQKIDKLGTPMQDHLFLELNDKQIVEIEEK